MAQTKTVAVDLLDDDPIFQRLVKHVQHAMSVNDASHDFGHVLRVLNHARRIVKSELQSVASTGKVICPKTVQYAALLHDLNDHKYKTTAGETDVSELLIAHGVEKSWADRVELIIEHVSYSHEMRDPLAVEKAIVAHPEIAIVQDADRLDAIGATGIGRAFTYGGAKDPERGMDGTVQHFIDKLERVKFTMKTDLGRQLAEERTDRLRLFRQWWNEEQEESVI